MLNGERVKALSQELLISRSVLCSWLRQSGGRCGRNSQPGPARTDQVKALEAKVAELEAAVGRKTLEADFFQGALRRLAAMAGRRKKVGGTSSVKRSANEKIRKAD